MTIPGTFKVITGVPEPEPTVLNDGTISHGWLLVTNNISPAAEVATKNYEAWEAEARVRIVKEMRRKGGYSSDDPSCPESLLNLFRRRMDS